MLLHTVTATHAMLHTQSSWSQQGFLTHTRCHVHHLHTQSVSHTRCLCHHPHSYTGLVTHLQESLHPIHLRDSDTHRTSSLSTISRNRGCHRHLHTHTHTHTHTHSPSSLPSITGSHQAIIVPPTDILSVCHSRHLCHTDCCHPPTQTLTSSYALGAPTGLPVQNPPSSVPCFQ